MSKHHRFARAANTTGVRATIEIDPTQITPRIKNKLLTWLETHNLDGGYRSQARKLGELIADKFDLPLTMKAWRGVTCRVTNRELADELTKIVQADWAASLLENPRYAKVDWYVKNYDECLAYLANPNGEQRWFYLHDPSFAKQARNVLMKCITDEERERVQRAVAALNGTEPIHCFTT